MIRPIDLQTLYGQMSRVGKDHALSRDNVLQQQQTEAHKLQKVHDQQSHAVTKIQDEADEEVAKIKLDEETSFASSGNDKQKNSPKNNAEDHPEGEQWQDPQVGHHVDVSG